MYSQPKYKFQKWNIFVQIIEEEKMKAKNLVDNYKAKIWGNRYFHCWQARNVTVFTARYVIQYVQCLSLGQYASLFHNIKLER